MSIETLEALPGEGEIKIVEKRRLRNECDVCGEPAHFKHTFLFENARGNPASSAYRHDDCSWCEDAHRYVCKEHHKDKDAPPGTSWCSTFPASERFAHLFLYWEEVEKKNG